MKICLNLANFWRKAQNSLTRNLRFNNNSLQIPRQLTLPPIINRRSTRQKSSNCKKTKTHQNSIKKNAVKILGNYLMIRWEKRIQSLQSLLSPKNSITTFRRCKAFWRSGIQTQEIAINRKLKKRTSMKSTNLSKATGSHMSRWNGDTR